MLNCAIAAALIQPKRKAESGNAGRPAAAVVGRCAAFDDAHDRHDDRYKRSITEIQKLSKMRVNMNMLPASMAMPPITPITINTTVSNRTRKYRDHDSDVYIIIIYKNTYCRRALASTTWPSDRQLLSIARPWRIEIQHRRVLHRVNDETISNSLSFINYLQL